MSIGIGMTKRRGAWTASAIAAAAMAAVTPLPAGADDAAVLPAGVSRVHLDYYGYLPVKERYSPDGEREPIAHPFDDAALDSTVFESLQPLDPLVGGRASIGDVQVAYRYDIDVLDFGFQHGITDRLTVGLHIPYYWIRNDISTRFSSDNANVGLNPATGACCIPIAAGGQPFSSEDVQNLITSQFGFRRIESWRGEGIGDVEAGAKYRYLETRDWAGAVSGGIRVPTGHKDDPDDLTDVAWSFGNYALLARLHFDYKLSNLWRREPASLDGSVTRPGDAVVNFTLRYDYMLPDKELKRVGDTPDDFFTNNREKVERKLGDRVDLEVSGKYRLSRALSLSATYRYGFKFKDDISGNMGFRYESLEVNTGSREQIVVIGARYSTLAAYRAKKARVPMVFSIAYRDRFDARGPRSGQVHPKLRTRWIVAGFAVFF